MRTRAGLGRHALLTTEAPGHPDKAEVRMTREQAIEFLKKKGFDAQPVLGKYGAEERSILVKNPKDFKLLTKLAQVTGQDSVLESTGKKHRMYFLHGENAGTFVEGKGTEFFDKDPEDYYTKPEKGGKSFRHNLDFDKRKKSRKLREFLRKGDY